MKVHLPGVAEWSHPEERARLFLPVPAIRGLAVQNLAPVGESTDAERSPARDLTHPGRMTSPTTSPAPGGMTVPPLFGWEVLLVVLVVLVVLAVVFLAFGATRASRTERSEWQAWLDTRSAAELRPARGQDGAAR